MASRFSFSSSVMQGSSRCSKWEGKLTSSCVYCSLKFSKKSCLMCFGSEIQEPSSFLIASMLLRLL